MQSITEPPRPSPAAQTTTPPHTRRTEESDAHLPIREHEDQPKRKKEHDKRDPLTLPEDVYDQATLGVRAVIDFLQKFLKSLDTEASVGPASAPAAGANAPAPDHTTAAPHTAANPAAARAASAYAHTARGQTSGQMLQPENGNEAAAKSLLASAEIRQIHELLAKLNTLDSRGVVGIKLDKADSFLQSLMNAADTALRSE